MNKKILITSAGGVGSNSLVKYIKKYDKNCFFYGTHFDRFELFKSNVEKKFLVSKVIHANKFKDELIIRIRKLKFGNHLKKTTDMGPLVNKSVKENLLNKIKKINKTKYNINFFGKISKNFVPPIIITHKKNLLEFIDDEFFGPIVQLITFEKLSECVKAINKSNYALQAGIFTNSNQYINYAYENLIFGALIVNAGPGLRIESIPFAGLKDSGSGREGIVMTMNEMMEEKVLIN